MRGSGSFTSSTTKKKIYGRKKTLPLHRREKVNLVMFTRNGGSNSG